MFRVYSFGLSASERDILRVLAQLRQPVSQSKIAEYAGLHHATVKRSIRRLEAKRVITITGSGNRVPFAYRIRAEKLDEPFRLEIVRLHREAGAAKVLSS